MLELLFCIVILTDHRGVLLASAALSLLSLSALCVLKTRSLELNSYIGFFESLIAFTRGP